MWEHGVAEGAGVAARGNRADHTGRYPEQANPVPHFDGNGALGREMDEVKFVPVSDGSG